MTDPGTTAHSKHDRGRAVGKKRTAKRTVEENRERYRADAAALQERLAAEVERLTESDRWRQFLRFSRSFHTYSLRNLLLILAQKPDATRVAGYRQWLEKGRQVKQGEKSIAIFGYAVDKREVEDPQTGRTKVEERPWYPIRRVFDISQTELKPGAEDHSTITAQLDADDPAGIYDKVAAHMAAKGWTVARVPIRGETDGYTTMDGSKRIVVDANLSPADAAATMLHESAHATLHADDPYWRTPDGSVAHRALAEVQAESVTYAVADMAGLDTSSYSIGYVAGWANGDPDKIRQAADGVLRGIRELAPAVLVEQSADRSGSAVDLKREVHAQVNDEATAEVDAEAHAVLLSKRQPADEEDRSSDVRRGSGVDTAETGVAIDRKRIGRHPFGFVDRYRERRQMRAAYDRAMHSWTELTDRLQQHFEPATRAALFESLAKVEEELGQLYRPDSAANLTQGDDPAEVHRSMARLARVLADAESARSESRPRTPNIDPELELELELEAQFSALLDDLASAPNARVAAGALNRLAYYTERSGARTTSEALATFAEELDQAAWVSDPATAMTTPRAPSSHGSSASTKRARLDSPRLTSLPMVSPTTWATVSVKLSVGPRQTACS